MPLKPVSAEMVAALSSKRLRACMFFQAEVADGTVRLWTGSYSIDWASYSWAGAGLFLSFSGTSEALGVQANGWSVTLSGLSSELAAAALDYIIQGKLGFVWLGALDDDGFLIDSPVKIASGRIDVPTLTEGETSTISLSFESVFIDLKTLREFRWTDQSQRLLYPGDPSLEFVTSIQNKDFSWGRS